ncbi:MAG: hypothetical protein ACXWRE_02640 [Pseudobdellovibrionaceae bacterium]
MKLFCIIFLGFSLLSINAKADEFCGTVSQQVLSSGRSQYYIENESAKKQIINLDNLLSSQVGNQVCAIGEPIGMYGFEATSVGPSRR